MTISLLPPPQVCALAYAIVFRHASIWSYLWAILYCVVVDWLLIGFAVASTCRFDVMSLYFHPTLSVPQHLSSCVLSLYLHQHQHQLQAFFLFIVCLYLYQCLLSVIWRIVI